MLRLLQEQNERDEAAVHYTMGAGLEAMRRANGGDLDTGTSSFYHFDALGSPFDLTALNEAITDTYLYNAWGETLARTGSTVNPHTYVGRERYYRVTDALLYQLGLRYYSATASRFTSRDLAGTANARYLYVGNQPASGIDPTGLAWWDPIEDIVGGGLTGNCYIDCMPWAYPTPPGNYLTCVTLCDMGYSPYLWPAQVLCDSLDWTRDKVGRDCFSCVCGLSNLGDIILPTGAVILPFPPWAQIIGLAGMASEGLDCLCNISTICDKGVLALPLSAIATVFDCVAPFTAGEPVVDVVTQVLQEMEQEGAFKQKMDDCCTCMQRNGL